MSGNIQRRAYGMNMYVRCCGADMNLPMFFLLHVLLRL